MYANIGEENQFTGLVARSKSSLQRAEDSAAATSVAPPPSNTGDRCPASHAHEPTVADETVDTTSILLMHLDQVLAAATAAKAHARINKHQCALAVRRLRLIAVTLRKMPRPAPSQPLLTAMQSLCLLLRQCAHDGGVVASTAESATALQILYGPDGDPLGPAQCWPVLLYHHFTSQLFFQGAYRRLWAAWSMYSHVDLEREDGVAESLDCAEDGQVMMELLLPMSVSGREADQSAFEEVGSVSHHLRDLQAYHQRRKMSPWRILYQDLKPTDQLVLGASRPRSASASAPPAATVAVKHHADGEKDVRFRVLPHVYRYSGVPVVVKALCGAAGTSDAETQEVAMQHATEFVLDVGCRSTWCHPHIVTCLGGYTERFVDDAESSNASAVRVEVDEKAGEERPASAAMASFPWQCPVSAVTGKPIMALGYVLELQSARLLSTAADSAQASYVTLHDLLFAPPSSAAFSSASLPVLGRHHFTLHEALDICSQIADALQYIMSDSHEVSEAVQTAWLTVDPANVFVVRMVGLNGDEEPVHQQERQQKGGVSGDQHARDTSSPLSVNSESAAWAASVTPFAEGGSREEAPVASQPDLQIGSVKASEDGGGRVDRSLPYKADTVQTRSERETEVYVCGGRKGDRGGAEDALRLRSKHFVVRYSPPCRWTPHQVAGSRWRPHARATAPASYVVVQLFLALLTGQVPYAYIKTDREVEERVFAGATHQLGNTSGTASCLSGAEPLAPVKPSSSSQGYRIPPSLPPMVANWCRRALSLDHSQPPMELEALRNTLTTIQASLPDNVRHAHLHAGEDAAEGDRGAGGGGGGGGPNQEMQSCMSGETLDV
ncbi:hypothetical protein, conserved [Leishmania donovani]|uniref:Protein kinase domain family protein n=2 Tax=Leishmania donovani TaxID=5661 RepID=E9BHL1_LEIDO|nr:hypothetical protein, conserved [Leishmania donovani]CBZ34737.1 hypothetical protein, conserved [Leishmania donovani]